MNEISLNGKHTNYKQKTVAYAQQQITAQATQWYVENAYLLSNKWNI